jgi:23S rRNA (guanosine2251-2'-O)-methyltransferase
VAYLTGFHAIEEHIRAGRAAESLLVAKPGPRARAIAALAREHRIPETRTGTAELDRLAPGHRGLVLETGDAETGTDVLFEDCVEKLRQQKKALILLLDEITDPHNFGAILRSCDQFGVDLVVTRNRRAARNSSVVSQASAGAAAWVATAEVPNLPRAVDMLKEAGFWIFGADMHGDPVFKKDLTGRIAVILGGEGSGLSRLLRENCDGLIAIPSKGRVDSLNVSVAAGIILYEITRQWA